MGGGRQVPEPPVDSATDPTLNFSISTSNLPDGAGKGCYIAPNVAVGIPLSSSPLLWCDPGFYCPHLNTSDPATLPVYCPPSPGCGAYRLQNLACSAQGKYEPILCKPGFYCTTPLFMLPCPAGFFCPSGTVKPRKCDILSLCPTGTITPTVYSPIVVMLTFDFIIACILIFMKYRTAMLQRRQAAGAGLAKSHDSPLVKMFGTWFYGPTYELEERARDTALEADGMYLPQTYTASRGHRRTPTTDAISVRSGLSSLTAKSSGSSSLDAAGEMKILVDAFTKALGSRTLRMNFKFEGLSLTLKNGRRVLEGVTGEIKSKRMTAILGPSGAGKTTFMNVLMGKINGTGGRLFINGVKTEMHLYRKIVGYVPQEDVMLRELTVRENLLHSARIRLPKTWKAREIEEHVDNVIKALNLSAVAHTLIGDENSRGVSGGQRKRVNIGMELAAAPLAIFLDEPTSGLDSTAALDVAEILSNIAQLGLTIVAVIHQPRIEIFRKFDDVVMIAPGGQVVYLGPTSLAQRYFESLGYEFEPGVNTSDALMDILAGKGVNQRATFTTAQLVEVWEQRKSRHASQDIESSSNMSLSSSTTYHAGPTHALTKPTPAYHGQTLYSRDHYVNDPPESPTIVDEFSGQNPQHRSRSSSRGRSVKVRDVSPVNHSSNNSHFWGLELNERKHNNNDARLDDNESERSSTEDELWMKGYTDTASRFPPTGQPSSMKKSRDLMPAISSTQSIGSAHFRVGSQQQTRITRPRKPELGISMPASVASFLEQPRAGRGSDDGIPLLANPGRSRPIPSPPNYPPPPRHLPAPPALTSSQQNSVRRTPSVRSLGAQSINAMSSYEHDRISEEQVFSMPATSLSKHQDMEFHRLAPQVVRERGARFMWQVWYCHNRYLIQQSRYGMALVLEICVAMFAGFLMGISTQGKVKELFNGIYWGDYVLLSPAPLDLVSLYGLLIGIAVALAGSPAGVKVFGEEKTVFWREAASGHHKLAYYIGKTLSTFYRLILTSLHFTGMYMLLAKPVMSVYMQYACVLLQFWGVYGMACVISMVVRRENASLLAVVMGLFAAVFCGYGPNLIQARNWNMLWLFEMSFNKWAAEAQYAASVAIYRNRYDVDVMAAVYGYSLNQVTMDLVMAAVLGLAWRAVGYILLVSLHRDKQR